MNITPYRNHVVDSIQKQLATPLADESMVTSNDDIRMRLLLQDAAIKFLSEIALDCPETTMSGSFWEHGPEIQLPAWHDNGKADLRRFRPTPVDGGVLSAIQEILVLELQVLVLTCRASLGRFGDTLVDLSSGNFGRWVMARLAMQIAGRGSWTDPHFWGGYIAPAGIFNTRLLGDLERMLSRTYENKPATTSVILVEDSVAKALRWSNWLVQATNLFEGEKLGLHLSDSESTSFVFGFKGSEFLGIYDTRQLENEYLRGDVPHFRWRVLPDRRIEGSMQGDVCVSYSQGQWRLIDLHRAFEQISRVEPSLLGANTRVWELCVHQSKNREGCLILIVDDAEQIVRENVVQAREINTCPNRIIAALGDQPSEPILHSDFSEIPIKSVILEQFRGKRVSDVPVTVLSSLARIDGAVVITSDGYILGFGIILRPPVRAGVAGDPGARTTAARAASYYGLAIKVSDDGPITGFRGGDQIG